MESNKFLRLILKMASSNDFNLDDLRKLIDESGDMQTLSIQWRLAKIVVHCAELAIDAAERASESARESARAATLSMQSSISKPTPPRKTPPRKKSNKVQPQLTVITSIWALQREIGRILDEVGIEYPFDRTSDKIGIIRSKLSELRFGTIEAEYIRCIACEKKYKPCLKKGIFNGFCFLCELQMRYGGPKTVENWKDFNSLYNDLYGHAADIKRLRSATNEEMVEAFARGMSFHFIHTWSFGNQKRVKCINCSKKYPIDGEIVIDGLCQECKETISDNWSPRETPSSLLQMSKETESSENSAYQRRTDGTRYVYKIAQKYFHDVNWTTPSNSGILIINGTTLVKVKNWTIPIYRSEVDKFPAEVKERKLTRGVFISLNSPIAGMKNYNIITNRSNLLIYIASNNELEIKMAIRLACR